MKRAMVLAALVARAVVATPAFAQPMDHAGMDHGMMDHTAPDVVEGAPPPAPAPDVGIGTDATPGNALPPPVAHDRPADRFFGAQAMAPAEAAMMGAHGGARYAKLTFDLAEVQVRDGRDSYRWEAEAWFGDVDRLVLRSKGEGELGGGVEHAEVQAVYAKALDAWWNLQAGLRQDIGPRSARTYVALGLEGRAPYQFDVQAALFVSHKGEVTARVEGFYDQRLTQRLVLQPRVELNLAAQDMPDLRTGGGLSSVELGLRLRYEIRRELAPYAGVSWTRLAGRTAAYARSDGHDPDVAALVMGVRVWF